MINILGKLPFSPNSDSKKEKGVVSFMHEQNIIFTAKHSWTTLRMSRPGRQSFAGGGLLANEKEERFASNDN